MNNIGLRIKQLRERKGITQEQLGEAVGVLQSNISMIECGRSRPSWAVAEKLAKFFGITLAELLAGELEPVYA
jgi:Predicted transcriptional regulators